jgi:hypothetical protein
LESDRARQVHVRVAKRHRSEVQVCYGHAAGCGHRQGTRRCHGSPTARSKARKSWHTLSSRDLKSRLREPVGDMVLPPL